MAGYDDIKMEGELDDVSATETSGNEEGQQNEVPEQTWDGSQFPLKKRGDVYHTQSREELINLAQQGFAYNQAQEQFNNDRRGFQTQLDEMKKKFDPYEQFDSVLRQHPALSQRIQQVAQEYLSQQSDPQPNNSEAQNPMYGQLLQKIEALEKMNADREQAEDDRKVMKAVQELREKYPHHDWETDEGVGNLSQQIIRFALDNGIYNLDHAYRVMMWDQNGTNAKASALKQAAAAKQQAAKAGIVRQGQTANAVPKKSYSYGDSYNELASRMAQELNV